MTLELQGIDPGFVVMALVRSVPVRARCFIQNRQVLSASKCLVHVEVRPVTQHVVTGAGQFVREPGAPARSRANGDNAPNTSSNSLRRRFRYRILSSSSVTTTTLLLECKSIPAYTLFMVFSFRGVLVDTHTFQEYPPEEEPLNDYQTTNFPRPPTCECGRFGEIRSLSPNYPRITSAGSR